MARRPHSPVLDASSDPSDADVEAALAALPAEKLRSFVGAYLRGLDAPARRALWAALVPSAARRPGAGTTKRSADATLCEDIAAFVRTATRVGEGSPAAVDSFLERATRVFLNGDAALARRAFEAILRPLAAAEFSLGEDESLGEVLSTPLDEVVARYLVTVYLTTPAGDRPGAIWDALERFGSVGTVLQPLAAMERAAAAPLDDLTAFAAAWATFLEGRPHGPRTGYGWGIGADRMLREAVARAHGVEGLRRLAETSGGVEAFDDWATALLAEDRREAALKALQAAIARVPSGDDQAQFADRAARVALALDHPRVAHGLLHQALRAEPTVERLLRWVAFGEPATAKIVERAREERAEVPRVTARVRGALDLLVGEYAAGAAHLAKADGFGWSDEEHAGHVLFPGLLVALMGAAAAKHLLAGIGDVLGVPDPSPWIEAPIAPLRDRDPGLPVLSAPTLLSVLERTVTAQPLDPAVRPAVLAALRSAAEHRVEGVLGEKRRREYDHAARLTIAVGVAYALTGNAHEAEGFVQQIQVRYPRHVAFQDALLAAATGSRTATAWVPRRRRR
jgi:tetratricopeptide (TPR) repeat protein